MARKTSLPEEVTRFKPCKCARIRNDGGIYRVYKYSTIKLASGEWGSNYGYLIGKIIPGEGFFQNKCYQKGPLNKTINHSLTVSQMCLTDIIPSSLDSPEMCAGKVERLFSSGACGADLLLCLNPLG